MGAVLRTSGSFAIRPSTIRAGWALGWPIAVWSWSLVNPWLTGPSGPFAVETWLFEVLPAPALVLGSLSILALPFASRLRAYLPDAPTRADRKALIAALVLTASLAVVAIVTPSATTVVEWERLLRSPTAAPAAINRAEQIAPPHGMRSAFVIHLRAPDVLESVEPRPGVPVGDHVLVPPSVTTRVMSASRARARARRSSMHRRALHCPPVCSRWTTELGSCSPAWKPTRTNSPWE